MGDSSVDVEFVVGASREDTSVPDAVEWAVESIAADVSVRATRYADCGAAAVNADVVVFDVLSEEDWTATEQALESLREEVPMLVFSDCLAVDEDTVRARDGESAIVQQDGSQSESTLATEISSMAAATDTEEFVPRVGNHLEAVMEMTSDAVVTIDESSTIRFVTPAIENQLGYEPADLIGEPLTKLMPKSLASRHLEGFTNYLETGERNVDWEFVELTGNTPTATRFRSASRSASSTVTATSSSRASSATSVTGATSRSVGSENSACWNRSWKRCRPGSSS